jgi:hypothetical protein
VAAWTKQTLTDHFFKEAKVGNVNYAHPSSCPAELCTARVAALVCTCRLGWQQQLTTERPRTATAPLDILTAFHLTSRSTAAAVIACLLGCALQRWCHHAVMAYLLLCMWMCGCHQTVKLLLLLLVPAEARLCVTCSLQAVGDTEEAQGHKARCGIEWQGT